MGGWTYAIEVVTGALAIEHAVAVLDVAHGGGGSHRASGRGLLGRHRAEKGVHGFVTGTEQLFEHLE